MNTIMGGDTASNFDADNQEIDRNDSTQEATLESELSEFIKEADGTDEDGTGSPDDDDDTDDVTSILGDDDVDLSGDNDDDFADDASDDESDQEDAD